MFDCQKDENEKLNIFNNDLILNPCLKDLILKNIYKINDYSKLNSNPACMDMFKKEFINDINKKYFEIHNKILIK